MRNSTINGATDRKFDKFDDRNDGECNGVGFVEISKSFATQCNCFLWARTIRWSILIKSDQVSSLLKFVVRTTPEVQNTNIHCSTEIIRAKYDAHLSMVK